MAISAPIAAAGIGAAGALGGGFLGASGAESAAQISANTQLGIFDQTQKNLAPFIQMGGSAFSNLGALLGFGPGGLNAASGAKAMNLVQSLPGYQFQMNQGVQAVDRSSAARGLNLSGGQLKDLTQFGQGTAQNAWNSYIGQLSNAAGLGESAAAGQGYVGAQTGASAGNALLEGGLAGTNYMVGGLQGGLNNATLGYLLSQQGGGAPGSGSVEDISMSDLSPYTAMQDQYSDVRLKRDIRRVGKTDEGMGVYLFRYRDGDPRTHMGVMAQEVEKTRPDAVREDSRGFKMVNYAKLATPLARYFPDEMKEAA
jgi:Chaperone of endosialidase